MRLEPNVLADRVLLRFNSRESVDWLIPTIRAISFLGHLLCSKAKTCDFCSEVSCLYIRNTKIINLRESSKRDFFVLPVWLFGATRPGRFGVAPRGVFHGLEPMKNEEKGEAQFRKNRKFAESRSALCPLRSQRPLPPCFARGIGRPTYLFSPPQITPTHEAISTSRSHCPDEPERRRTNAYIHRQAHGGARRKIGHHRTPHRDGLPHRARR